MKTLQVGFYMETGFHYDVYRNIILALQAQQVACTLVISDTIEPAFVREMVERVKTLRHPQLAVVARSALTAPFDCLVSPYYTPLLHGLARHHVRALYGLAKDRWGHAWWNCWYDTLLCYGEHSRAALDIQGTAVTVGNPRFDDWHQQRYPRALVNALARNKQKLTVLYAPTYGALSSIPHWAKALGELQDQVTLLVRLHHGTRLRAEEAPARALIQRYLARQQMHEVSPFALLEAADIVLTDNSGFLFDALHAGKRTVLLEWRGLQALLAGDQTYGDLHSAEQQARRHIETAGHAGALRNLIAGHASWQPAAGVAHFRQHYCDAFMDGLAGERAAAAIIAGMTQAAPERFYLQSLRARLFAGASR